jgi:hypothetical protein
MQSSKIAIFVVIIFTIMKISACGEPKNQRLTDCHYMINGTGKKIVHELICISKYVDEDTFRFYSNGVVNQPELEWVISCIVGKAGPHTPTMINYSSFSLYNISDTSFLYWKYFSGGYDNPQDKYPQYFDGGVNGRSENNETETVWTVDFHLTVTDSLLLLMQKDYTMLHKFSEYYAQ